MGKKRKVVIEIEESTEEVESIEEIHLRLEKLAKKYDCFISYDKRKIQVQGKIQDPNIIRLFVNENLSEVDKHNIYANCNHWNLILGLQSFDHIEVKEIHPQVKEVKPKNRTTKYDNKDFWIELLYNTQGDTPTAKVNNCHFRGKGYSHQTVTKHLEKMKPHLKKYINNEICNELTGLTKLFEYFEKNKRMFDDIWREYRNSRRKP